MALGFIAELRERVERLESKAGAKHQLRVLDAKTAELKASRMSDSTPCDASYSTSSEKLFVMAAENGGPNAVQTQWQLAGQGAMCTL